MTSEQQQQLGCSSVDSWSTLPVQNARTALRRLDAATAEAGEREGREEGMELSVVTSLVITVRDLLRTDARRTFTANLQACRKYGYPWTNPWIYPWVLCWHAR